MRHSFFSESVFSKEKSIFEFNYESFGGNYTGKKLDTATGLYYFNQRYYDPELGVFMTEDPAGQSLNPYLYCANSPLLYVDPNGEWSFLGISLGAGVGLIGKDLKKSETWTDFAENVVAIAAVYAGYAMSAYGGMSWSVGVSTPLGNITLAQGTWAAAGAAAGMAMGQEQEQDYGMGGEGGGQKNPNFRMGDPNADYNVYAVEDGTVDFVGWESDVNPYKGFGYYIKTKDLLGQYYYGHMNYERVSDQVYKGALVSKGQYLGQYDYRQSGSSTGPHVHLGRKINGGWKNPGNVSPLNGRYTISSPWKSIDRAHSDPHGGVDAL